MIARALRRAEFVQRRCDVFYRFLADLTLIAHGLFVLFVVFGGFLVLRRPRLAWIHVPTATWGALIEFFGWTCPLTPLENYFRELGGQAGYRGGFIEHYIVGLLYPRGLTRTSEVLLGVLVLAINGVFYALLWRGARSR